MVVAVLCDPSRRTAYRRLRGLGICPVASRAAALSRVEPCLLRLPFPPPPWPADSVPGAGRYRGDCAYPSRRGRVGVRLSFAG